MRDVLFISHANPEDNEFALWIALRLAREGYAVWCDLVDLLGGEDFWKDIEKVIRGRTVKFLYVLSRASNIKQGPLSELQVAQNVMRDHRLDDFVIPLSIDDLPYREINIQLSRINVISFGESWIRGFRQLLEKLEKDAVPTTPGFAPSTVRSWWRTHFSVDDGVIEQREEYLSNWFPIDSLPEQIRFHELARSSSGPIEVPATLPYPAFQHNQYLVSFAAADNFAGCLGPSLSIAGTHDFSTQDLLDGKLAEKFVKRESRKDFVTRLLKDGWWKLAETKGLRCYSLSSHTPCWWFPKGAVAEDKITFKGVNGLSTWRSMIGYKTRKRPDGTTFKQYWHFGIQAKPIVYPILAYVIKPHVLFSYDARELWESKKRMHRARRSQCRNWWNADWRDRTLASMQWLASAGGAIEISFGSTVSIKVKCEAVPFISEVSFSDPASIPLTPDTDNINAEDESDEFEGEGESEEED